MSPRPKIAALSACLIAAIALAVLVTQFQLNASKPGLALWSVRLSDLARYFTYLTKVLVTLHMVWAGLGRAVAPDIGASVVLADGIVGIVYWTLLAPVKPIEGLGWYTNLGLHSVLPGLTVAWWLAFGPQGLRLARMRVWLIWPLVYCIYAMIQEALTGSYPYFFVGIATYGVSRVLVNILGPLAGFAVAGALLWALTHIAQRAR